jgi:hypothetical protein
MEENSPSKQITFLQPEGSQKKGRSKLRWLDSVFKDIKLLKVETWWKKAHGRNIWGGSSRRPRSTKDCRARGRRREYYICSLNKNIAARVQCMRCSRQIVILCKLPILKGWAEGQSRFIPFVFSLSGGAFELCIIIV